IQSKKRPPKFGYDALFRTARVPTTLFSLFQKAILEFLHKLSRSRLRLIRMKLPRLWIGGKWHETRATKDVINPATGELLARVPLGDGSTIEAALGAAQQAF